LPSDFCVPGDHPPSGRSQAPQRAAALELLAERHQVSGAVNVWKGFKDCGDETPFRQPFKHIPECPRSSPANIPKKALPPNPRRAPQTNHVKAAVGTRPEHRVYSRDLPQGLSQEPRGKLRRVSPDDDSAAMVSEKQRKGRAQARAQDPALLRNAAAAGARGKRLRRAGEKKEAVG
jgi:hypothetical protein